jgi:hypothetical protein
MSDTARWIVGIALALVLIGLMAYARGPEHHRGIAVGERPPGTTVSVSPLPSPVSSP